MTKDPLIPSRPFRARVRRFIVDHRLIRAGDRVLVAISGGPDSTCLLLILASLRRSLDFELHAAHFDHGLRGPRAAARELRFARTLAEKLGVPLHTGAGDVRAHARGASIEEAARELRYRFLARAARAARCRVVAAGHTKDDQAETVLLRLLRGSGLRGLAAMGTDARWPVAARGVTPRLARPLLALSRAETEACCRDAGLRPLRDPSNRSPAFLRNRVRAELLPLLRRYNPRIDDALVRLASSASGDVELLEALAAAAPMRANRGEVRLRRRALRDLPPALQRHAVRGAVARLLGSARGLSERHVLAVLRANDGPASARLDLPGLQARVTRDTVVLTTGRTTTPPPLPARSVPLALPGTTRIGAWRIEATMLRRRPIDLRRTEGGAIAYLDAGAIGGRLSLRRRRPGDRFQPLGLARPKKLQDFLVDARVPRAERDTLPLLVGQRGIAWVPGQRPADWAKVTAATGRVLRLRAARGA